MVVTGPGQAKATERVNNTPLICPLADATRNNGQVILYF